MVSTFLHSCPDNADHRNPMPVIYLPALCTKVYIDGSVQVIYWELLLSRSLCPCTEDIQLRTSPSTDDILDQLLALCPCTDDILDQLLALCPCIIGPVTY